MSRPSMCKIENLSNPHKDMKKKAAAIKQTTPIVVRVVGTSPLSFELRIGDELSVKEIGPSAINRPTVGGKFNSTAYLLFKGITKVGRFSPKTVEKLKNKIPRTCKVVQIDKVKKVVSVELPIE